MVCTNRSHVSNKGRSLNTSRVANISRVNTVLHSRYQVREPVLNDVCATNTFARTILFSLGRTAVKLFGAEAADRAHCAAPD